MDVLPLNTDSDLLPTDSDIFDELMGESISRRHPVDEPTNAPNPEPIEEHHLERLNSRDAPVI